MIYWNNSNLRRAYLSPLDPDFSVEIGCKILLISLEISVFFVEHPNGLYKMEFIES